MVGADVAERPAAIRIAVIGTAGLPPRYGGFETLADNLVRHHYAANLSCDLSVYCSGRKSSTEPIFYMGARLRYSRLPANGVASILYDVWSMLRSVVRRDNRLLVLGVSGAICLPAVRMFSRAWIITNVDGIEWRRSKWGPLARAYLKWSEYLAARWSHSVIADNVGIAEYLLTEYGLKANVIAYGGDQAAIGDKRERLAAQLAGSSYALSICRIEPENNIEMLLSAFSEMPFYRLVVVGNWEGSEYGRELRRRFGSFANITMRDPVYEREGLAEVRSRADLYVHGHSAGGTNPSLVEAMHLGIPIAAFDCSYNRYTTHGLAMYFSSAEGLVQLLQSKCADSWERMGAELRQVAASHYTWEVIAKQYFDLLCGRCVDHTK